MRTMTFLTLVAMAILAIASQARAGSPCCCPAPCVAPPPPVTHVHQPHVYQPYEVPRIYIVNRGPIYSGPGIYTQAEVVVPRPLPAYPYVAHDYPYYQGPAYLPRHRRAAIRVRY